MRVKHATYWLNGPYPRILPEYRKLKTPDGMFAPRLVHTALSKAGRWRECEMSNRYRERRGGMTIGRGAPERVGFPTKQKKRGNPGPSKSCAHVRYRPVVELGRFVGNLDSYFCMVRHHGGKDNIYFCLFSGFFEDSKWVLSTIVFPLDSLLFSCSQLPFPSNPYRAVGPELYRTWRR